MDEHVPWIHRTWSGVVLKVLGFVTLVGAGIGAILGGYALLSSSGFSWEAYLFLLAIVGLGLVPVATIATVESRTERVSPPLGVPVAVAIAGDGTVFVADCEADRVARLTLEDPKPLSIHRDLPAFSYAEYSAYDVAVAPDGALLVADLEHHCVRRIDREAKEEWLKHGTDGTTSEQLGSREALLRPIGVTASRDGTIFVSTLRGDRIWQRDHDDRWRVLCGTGERGGAGLLSPRRLAVTADGRLLFSEKWGNRVRALHPDGTLTLVAGAGTRGNAGDGGPAVNAELAGPDGLALDADERLLIADAGNHRVRVITPDGTILPFAGSGRPGHAGDGGPATAARLRSPCGVAVHPSGKVVIADSGNGWLRVVDQDGTIRTLPRR
jgi:DNA-binding beta-propeller fold protein YncE